ncbi:MAG: M17 family peptidase N-terminal domain-containing protein [Nitrospirota bacterium]
MSPVKIIAQRATKLHAGALVAGFFKDDRPLAGLSAEIDWIHNGIISHLILRGRIRGDLKETTLLATQRKLHVNNILLIGLGKKDPLTPQTLQEVYSHISHTLSQLHITDYAVEWFGPTGPAVEEAKIVEAVLAGLGTDPGRSIERTLLVPDEEKAQRIRQRMQSATGDA